VRVVDTDSSRGAANATSAASSEAARHSVSSTRFPNGSRQKKRGRPPISSVSFVSMPASSSRRRRIGLA